MPRMKLYLYRDGKLVDGVLTFIELRQLFDEFKIQERLVKMSDFDPPHGNWGALYPLPAGIIQAGGIKRDMVIKQCNNCFRQGRMFLRQLMISINILIQYIIILTSSSVMAVFSVPEWNITMKDSGEERW